MAWLFFLVASAIRLGCNGIEKFQDANGDARSVLEVIKGSTGRRCLGKKLSFDEHLGGDGKFENTSK